MIKLCCIFFKSIRRSVKHWYIPLILGILFILCGIGVIISPQDSYLTLSILFSLSFLISGITESFFALQNTKTLNGWGWYLVSGLISLIMGIFLLMYPALSMFILPCSRIHIVIPFVSVTRFCLRSKRSWCTKLG